MKKATLVISTFVLALSVSGCSAEGDSTAASSESAWSGMISVPDLAFDLEDYEPDMAGDPCNRDNLDDMDFPDVALGTSVTLRDSTGAVVGLTSITEGALSQGWYDDGKGTLSVSDDTCNYKFKFDNVESDDNFFSIEVGSRGEVNVTREDLELGLVFLTLG